MTLEFKYTTKFYFHGILISYLAFVLISICIPMFYGPIEADNKEIDYFLMILFGVPLLIFLLGINKYSEKGSMTFYEDSVKINFKGRNYIFRYSEISVEEKSRFRGILIIIKAKEENIKILATYFGNEYKLRMAYFELESRIEKINSN